MPLALVWTYIIATPSIHSYPPSDYSDPIILSEFEDLLLHYKIQCTD